jgi:hypothetical protein
MSKTVFALNGDALGAEKRKHILCAIVAQNT